MPYRTKPNPGKTRLLYAAFTVWLIAGSTALAQPPNAPAPPEPSGEWLVAKQVARIKIADCDGRLWGVVGRGSPTGIDSKNPDSQPPIPTDAGNADPARYGIKQNKQMGGPDL